MSVIDQSGGTGDDLSPPALCPQPYADDREREGAAATDALRASEERFRALSEHASDLVSILDMDGVYQYVSPSHRRILGYAPEDLQGRNALGLVHPDDVARVAEILERGRAVPGAIETIELRVRHADGSWRTMELVGTNRLHDPAVRGIIVNAHDITDRKRAEDERIALLARAQAARADALARAGERDAVFEAMADGVLVCDKTGQAVHMNAAYQRLLGLDATSLDLVLRPEKRGTVFAARDATGQLLQPDQWPMARVLRGEVMTGAYTMDILVHTLDGREVVINASGAPVRDAAGDIQGGVVIFRDVTERRAMEQRTHEELDALLNMAAALVQGLERDTKDGGDDMAPLRGVARELAVLTCNVFGCTHVNIIGVGPSRELQPLAQVGLTPDQERQWHTRIAGGAIVSDASLYEALWSHLSDGESVIVDTTRAPFAGMANPFGLHRYLISPMRVGRAPVGLLVVDYGQEQHAYTDDDIALAEAIARLAALAVERERLLREREAARTSELALREANSRMEEFLSIAGHELRTPLTSVLGNIQLAERWIQIVRSQDGEQDGERGRAADEASTRIELTHRLLTRVESQVRLLNRLVGDLLDTSRTREGRLALRPAPCDLASILRDVAQEQQQRDPTRALLLDIPEGETAPVQADHDRITQVVINYLSNALKYSDGDRPVTVGLRVEGGAARAWVRDEGPGLAPDEQGRVWERFYRAESAAHRYGSSVGLGLGLYISKAIVELHGGRVGVDSRPGEGATFWFTLPLWRT